MIIEAKSGNKYEVVIGLEIHAQINSDAKIFSKSPNNWNSDANKNISPMDVALPGALPVINIDAVEQVIATGLAIDAKINRISHFDRKNYFYPDLPSGYQITQFYEPIVEDGKIDIQLESGDNKTINIQRIHIEQDAGKSIHDRYSDKTSLDFNRSGVGLMEIVSHPDMRSPYEASEYVKKIRSILKTVQSSDADMEKGSMRVDANVSVRIAGVSELGTRCEIKNLNSIRSLQVAIEHEAKRHINLIEQGEKISQETRLFDADKIETRSMRKKEDSLDYKYFPDPDLPPLVISEDLIAKISNKLPELPAAKFTRYISIGLSEKEAKLLSENIEYSSYFDEVSAKHDYKTTYTWIMIEMLGRINKLNLQFSDVKISPNDMILLLDLIANGKINGKIAKTVLDEMFVALGNGKSVNPEEIVKNHGFEQIDNTDEITKMAQEVLEKCQQQVQEYKAGNQKLLGFFVGEIMKVAKGKANPASVNKILSDLLSK